GKGKKLRDGKDISIFCSGIEVAESMKAAEELAKEGIQADVIIHFHERGQKFLHNHARSDDSEFHSCLHLCFLIRCRTRLRYLFLVRKCRMKTYRQMIKAST
ncbi:MAG: hypothetical protein II166_09405, partial [Firmicutes bacterium]|nr:hypothetical protein [Bacillota bacterium]